MYSQWGAAVSWAPGVPGPACLITASLFFPAKSEHHLPPPPPHKHNMRIFFNMLRHHNPLALQVHQMTMTRYLRGAHSRCFLSQNSPRIKKIVTWCWWSVSSAALRWFCYKIVPSHPRDVVFPAKFIIFTTTTTASYLPSNPLIGRTKKCNKGDWT